MKARIKFFKATALLACGLGLLTGCGSFNREWARAQRAPGSKSESLVGAWQGKWKSDTNHHEGTLRCVVGKLEDGRYEFRYKATWAGVMTGEFRITCPASREGDVWKFRGSKDLGPVFGGIFSHEGTVHGGRLEAKYDSAMDDGIFALGKVGSTTASQR